MLDGSGLTITVLLAVTHVAVTVISLLLQLALARVTVIVDIDGIVREAQSIFQLTLLSTCQSVHQLGTHVGTLPPSLISFHVAQSNTAKCQSVELQGQTTSHVLEVYPLGLLES